jgi:hypothetical protein
MPGMQGRLGLVDRLVGSATLAASQMSPLGEAMDPITLAGAAVSLLAPYLGQLTGKVIDKASDQLAEGALPAVKRVHEVLKARLRPGSYAGNQLQGVEEKPGSEGRQRGLQSALAEVLEEDKEFAAELERLVTQAREAAGWHAEVGIVEGTAAFGGDVHQQADYLAGRDMTINSGEQLEPKD